MRDQIFPPSCLPASFSRRREGVLLAWSLGPLLLLACSAVAGDGMWVNPASGLWNEPANWSGGVPNSPGDVAAFAADNPVGDAMFILTGETIVGRLEVTNPNRLQILGTGPLVLDQLGGGKTGTIQVDAGRLQIDSTVELQDDDLLLRVPHRAARLSIGGPIRGAGGVQVDAGRVDLEGVNTFAGPLRIGFGGQVEIGSLNSYGGTQIDAGGQLLIGASGSLVEAGQVTVDEGGELRIVRPAGEDPFQNSVAPNSVVLNDGMVTLEANIDPAGLFSSASTGGTLALREVPEFTAGAANVLDFSVIGGTGLRLGAISQTAIPAAVSLIPETTSQTLRFGGTAGTLTIEAAIGDAGGGPVHVEQTAGGTTVLASANTYTGTTTVRGGTLIVTDTQAVAASVEVNVESAGTLRLVRKRAVQAVKVNLNGGTLSGDDWGIATLVGPIELRADSTLTNLTSDGVLRLAGDISGPAGVRVRQGEVVLAGNNTFAGRLEIEHSEVEVLGWSAHGETEVGSEATLSIGDAGSMVGAGRVTVREGGQLRVVRSAGSDPTRNSLSPGGVLLAGGTLTLADNDFDLAGLLAPGPATGLLLLEDVPLLTAGGTNRIDFEAIGGRGVGLGAKTDTTIAAGVTLVPDRVSHTVRFAGGPGQLAIDGTIADVAGVPTNVVVGPGGNVMLSGTNLYTGTTTVGRGGTLAVAGEGRVLRSVDAEDGSILAGFEDAEIGPLHVDGLVTLGGSDFLLGGGTTGSGTLMLKPRGTLSIDNAPLAHDGQTVVRGLGQVELRYPGAIGGAAVTVDGGTLIIAHAGDQPTATETLSVRGGGHLTQIAGSPGVAATEIIARRGTITAKLTGPGIVTKTSAGLVTLKGNNDYTGETTLGEGTLVVRHASGLGATSGGTTVQPQGVLQIEDVGAVSEPIELRGGWLRGLGELSGPVHTEGTGRITVGEGEIFRLSGPLTGTGTLRLDSTGWNGQGPTSNAGDELEIAGSIEQTGTLRLEGGGDLYVRGPIAVDGDLVIGGHAAGPTPNYWVGRVSVSADVSATELLLDGGFLALNRGAAVSSLSNELELRSGILAAQEAAGNRSVSGIAQIRKTTFDYGAVDSDAFSTPVTISVESGTLGIYPNEFPVAGPLRIGSAENAAIELTQRGTYNIDFDLNDGSGMNQGGALWNRQDADITGDIYLGESGAVIGGIHSTRVLRLHGAVTGGSLRIVGEGGTVQLTGAGISFVGQTVVSAARHSKPGGQLVVSDEAALTATSGIVIGRRGRLAFGGGPIPIADRIGDEIPISIRGGNLIFAPSDRANRLETVGTVRIEEGISTISVSTAAGIDPELTVRRLERSSGSIVQFRASGVSDRLGNTAPNSPRIFLAEPPPQTHGMIAGWAVVTAAESFDDDFATYDPVVGIKALGTADRASQVEGSTVADNVLIQTSEVTPLTQDTEINSLMLGPTISEEGLLALGGHTLNLLSGGLLGRATMTFRIAGGQLTAGDGQSPGELLVTNNGHELKIDAAITDQPGGESVALVKSGWGDVALSGVNVYTGPTIVNLTAPTVTDGDYGAPTKPGTLYFRERKAVPLDNTIIANGGVVRFEFKDSSPLDLGDVVIRHGGALATDLSIRIDADHYLLESGILGSNLVGNGPMIKTGLGIVTVDGTQTGYTGDITVEAGVLAGTTVARFGTGKVTVTGGRFIPYKGTHANPIQLDGGALGGIGRTEFQGALEVTADADLLTFNGRDVGTHRPFGQNPSTSLLAFRGPVTLSDGVTLTQLGSGEVKVEESLLVGHAVTIRNDNLDKTTWRVPDANVFSNPPDHDTGTFEITGVITANAADATVDLVGIGRFDLSGASVAVGDGQELAILRDDQTLRLDLHGDGVSVSGSGLLHNPVAVDDGAAIAPGESTGLLAIDGDVTVADGGRLAVELAGTVRGEQYDALDVSGQATIEGALQVDLIDGFVPEVGSRFDILTTVDGTTGRFAQQTMPPLEPGLTWNVSYAAAAVALDVVQLGDVNLDGAVNGLDIDPFVSVMLTGPYQGAADMTQNGIVNGLDVAPFVAAVTGAAEAVPEPSTVGLLVLVVLGVIVRRGKL